MPPLSRRRFPSGLATATAVAALPRVASARTAGSVRRPSPARELKCDVLIIGGISAALAAARMGSNVIVTEETSWIGGQATTQGVPPDEHPWIEQFGSTRTYRDFRTGVRDYYRRHYPITPEARADRYLNPGAAWVTALAFEPLLNCANSE